MFRIRRRNGQSALEYTALVIILVGALIGIQNYFKRGVQGRWKASVDSLGEQYDPHQASASLTHRMTGTTITNIVIVNQVNGTQTLRTDSSIMTETKSGFSQVDAY